MVSSFMFPHPMSAHRDHVWPGSAQAPGEGPPTRVNAHRAPNPGFAPFLPHFCPGTSSRAVPMVSLHNLGSPRAGSNPTAWKPFGDLGPRGAPWHPEHWWHVGMCRGKPVPAEEGQQPREAKLASPARGRAGSVLPRGTWKGKLWVHQEALG